MWFIIDFSHIKNAVKKRKNKFFKYKAHDNINLLDMWLSEQTRHDKMLKPIKWKLSDKKLH